jgi:prephenate dehydrogenase
VVCLAVPIPALKPAVDEWGSAADRAVVDVTGVMEPAVAAMRSAAPTVERVSLHPLFAPDAAPGNVAVVPDAPGPVTDHLRRALSAAGNDLFETTAPEHDEAMETVQARVHAAVLAFGLAAEDVPEKFQTPVSTAMFGLLDRVTGNDPRVYADIQAAFDGAGDVADAAADLAEADDETFEACYRAAARDGDRGPGPP